MQVLQNDKGQVGDVRANRSIQDKLYGLSG